MHASYRMACPRGRKVGRVVVLLAAILAVCCCVSRHRARSASAARHTATQIAQRALALMTAFWGPTELVGTPLLKEGDFVHVGKNRVRPRLWCVTCLSNNLRIELTFNDDTGNVCYVMGALENGPMERRVAPIKTLAEANDVGLRRLLDLQLLSPEEVSGLKLVPPRKAGYSAWSLVWTARASGEERPYRLYMGLDRRTGAPLWALNTRELRQVAVLR